MLREIPQEPERLNSCHDKIIRHALLHEWQNLPFSQQHLNADFLFFFVFVFFALMCHINISQLHSAKPSVLTFADGPRWFSRAWAAQPGDNVYLKSNTHSHAHIHTQIHIRRVPLYYLQVHFPFHCHYKRLMLWGRDGVKNSVHTGPKEKKKPSGASMEGIVKAGNGGYSEVLGTEIEKEPHSSAQRLGRCQGKGGGRKALLGEKWNPSERWAKSINDDRASSFWCLHKDRLFSPLWFEITFY